MSSNQTHWGKLYGSLCLHPKWLSTPAEGRALWTSALSYCMVISSDGEIPEGVLHMLNAPGTSVDDAVEQLLSNGLWERTEKGYAFHDWTDHQQTVEERKSIRAKRAEAGKASAEARKKAKSQGDSSKSATSVGTSAQQSLNIEATEKRREEKRREEPTADADASKEDRDETFNRFWSVYPKKESKIKARTIWDRLVKKTDPEEIIAGAERYAAFCKAEKKEKKYIKGPDGWLNAGRWEDEIEVTTIKREFNPWEKEAHFA